MRVVHFISDDPTLQSIAREASAPQVLISVHSPDHLSPIQPNDLVLLDVGATSETMIGGVRAAAGWVPIIIVGGDVPLEMLLDIGANDRVCGPVTVQGLQRAIAAWSQPPADAVTLLASAASLPGFDLDAAIERLPDVLLLGRLILQYLDSYPDLADELRSSVAAGEIVRADLVAHNARGTAGMLGITELERSILAFQSARAAGAPPAELEHTLAAMARAQHRARASAMIFRSPG